MKLLFESVERVYEEKKKKNVVVYCTVFYWVYIKTLRYVTYHAKWDLIGTTDPVYLGSVLELLDKIIKTGTKQPQAYTDQ